jgi:hypothetical protein
MLTAQDDFIGHQLPTTFDHVGTSDPAWMERMWYTGHPVPAGDIIFDIGLGYYPNKNVMDAFAGVTIDNVQHNIRMSRRLRPDPLLTRVGPLQIHVLEGLRRHRIVLAENDSGMSFDIEFNATLNPHEEEPHFRRRHGRVAEQIARAQQVGRYAGWIKAGGKRYELKPETWWGQRDRSWGIRAELHTDETKPPLSYFPPLLFSWSTIQFADHGLQWYFNERAPGEFIYITGEEVLPLGQPADRRRRITGVAHEITWADDSLGQTIDQAEFEMTFTGGAKRRVQIKMLPGRYYLKSGMYGGLRGWAQGDDKGPLHVEHDRWDLRDPEIRRLVRTLSDHVIEVRDGNSVGYGVMEYGVSPGYPKYKSIQNHPLF